MATFLKRRDEGDAKAKETQARTLGSSDESFAKKYPALSEFLSLEEWEPGVERTRGTITIFWEEGLFKASLNDRDSESVAFVSKPAFTGLLDALEKGLVKGDLDWRKWQGGAKGKQKKR